MISAPGHLPKRARDAWECLDSPTVTRGASFDPDGTDALPEPVARWMRHTVVPGTPPWRGVRLLMRGEIRVGRWQPFTARQILGPPGFVWAAKAGRPPLRISGFDSYVEGTGEMRWKLFGLVPVVTAQGDDASRSAAGRHAGEAVAFVPGGALDRGITWESIDARHALATVTHAGHTHRVTIDVDGTGRLNAISLPRWGDPEGGRFSTHTFGATFEGETTFADCTLPRHLHAGWWPGTDRWVEGEFFRATIDGAEFF